MDQGLVCVKCGELLIKNMGDSIKIRSKVLVFSSTNECVAVCRGCKTEINLPLKVDLDVVKSMSNKSQLRLYIKKK